ncbi:kinase-like protein [Gigaspora margarita]|uniref:Kinase-like protein n=1 Tax=Gigaspora margarita TaxID=4874 RepID=A0A8H3XAS6_GIGMA|nr:kinase-like protein [Gigaspora margarita]
MYKDTIIEHSEQLETYFKNKNIRTYEYSQIKKIINKSEPIGRGAHALVYIASLEGKTYAVKSFNNNVCIDNNALKRFKRELKILYNVNHPNVVKFYGISRDVESGNFMLLLQYSNGGSLWDNLKAKQQKGFYKIFWDELIQIVDDLTSTSSSGVKGLSAYIDPQHFHQQMLGKKFNPDKKTDIYSLGVLLWELTSGIPPFNKCPNVVIHLILEGKRERTISDTPLDYANLYTKCWSLEPDQRPTLEEISTELKKLSKEKTNKFIMNTIDNDDHTEPETTTSSMEFEFIVNAVNDDKQSKPETSIYSMGFSSNDNSKSLESDLCIIKEINNLHSAIPDENMLSKPETSTYSMGFSSNDHRKSHFLPVVDGFVYPRIH